MQKLLITALIISCAACADTSSTTANKQDIHASRFVYDASAKPIIVSGGNFVYDSAAPALRASSFVVEGNQ